MFLLMEFFHKNQIILKLMGIKMFYFMLHDIARLLKLKECQ